MDREDLVLNRISHQQFYEIYNLEISKEMIDRVYFIRIIEKLNEEGFTSETYNYYLIKSDLCYELNLNDNDIKTLEQLEVLRELKFYKQKAEEYVEEDTSSGEQT